MVKNDLAEVPVMDKFARHLKYYERQQRLLKAHDTKRALITRRKEMLEAQNRVNYQSEFNRLVGALSVNGHRGETIESIRHKRENYRARFPQLIHQGATLDDVNRIN